MGINIFNNILQVKIRIGFVKMHVCLLCILEILRVIYCQADVITSLKKIRTFNPFTVIFIWMRIDMDSHMLVSGFFIGC